MLAQYAKVPASFLAGDNRRARWPLWALDVRGKTSARHPVPAQVRAQVLIGRGAERPKAR
jgi:hypothetical protein